MKTAIVICFFLSSTCLCLSQDMNSKSDTLLDIYKDSTVCVFIPHQEIISKPEIVFPSELRSIAESATVFVNVFVDSLGSVRKAKVLKSSNKPFNKFALKYAYQYRFGWPKDAVNKFSGWYSIKIVFSQ